jgi:hypothetical protein
MTDKELVLELCKRLGLEQNDDPGSDRYIIDSPGPNRYIVDSNKITIGEGIGYNDFCVNFNFDGDKLINHGVWE